MKNSENEAVLFGVVTSGGASVNVVTDIERRQAELCVPYGVQICVPQGERVMLLPESDICLGTKNRSGGLSPGELRLYSLGGAEILLKNDGSVVINGRVFEKESVDTE